MSVLRKTDLVQRFKQETGGNKLYEQESDDKVKTIGASSYESLRTCCLS
jgi:hypothetical protein